MFGSVALRYQVVEGWGNLPKGWEFGTVIGLVVDSMDNVYVFNRSVHPLIVFNRKGEFLRSHGEGEFKSPHGLYIDSDDNLYCTDSDSHIVSKYTTEWELLQTWGTRDVPGGEGKPFNRPTNSAIAPSGDMYVTDGYGNSRVHRYSPEGELIQSWGNPGAGEGEFDVPHDVWVHRDNRVFVVDRQNNRLQIFTAEGEFLEEWGDFVMPCSIYIDADDLVYVSELGARMSILDIEGNLISRWGGVKSDAPGYFIGPHCAWADSHGDLYVGESLSGKRVQKFRRIP